MHRPVQVWTPTVHALLRFLRDQGEHGVPSPLSSTSVEEVLTLVPGASGADGWGPQATDEGLVSAARLLRRVHDASRGFAPPPDARWGNPALEPFEVVCHGDPGPWNMTWRGREAVGLFDWDFAHPGPRLDDVAYALEYFTPFRDDAEAVRWLGFTSPPDRPHRLRLFATAYGLASTEGLVDAVIARQERTVELVAALAAGGVEPQRTWVGEGFLDVLRERVAWSRSHRDLRG